MHAYKQKIQRVAEIESTVYCKWQPFLSFDVVCMDCRGTFRTVLDS